MENVCINSIMRLVSSLSIDLKLEVLSKVSESIKKELDIKNNSKEQLFNELCGAWSDMPESLTDNILSERTLSTKDINFD